MMIDNLIPTLIQRFIQPLIGEPGFYYGLPLVTSDGFALFTSDDQLLLASTSGLLSYSQPNQPLVTSDGFALIDSNKNLLLGA
jgi:hypothetical protein